jgi:hypothetical protein
MERVECVTDQVRWSHSGGGEVVGEVEVEVEAYLEGERRLIVVGILILFGYESLCCTKCLDKPQYSGLT